MSSSNTYRDTTSADYLNEIRKEIAQNKAANVRSTAPTPAYIIPVSNSVNCTDIANRLGYTPPFKVMAEDTGVAELTGYYKFNDTATDSSGGALDLTATGSPPYIAGQIRRAISLDGSTQYLQASANTVHDQTTNDFSIACWIYWTTDGGAATIVRKRSTGATDIGWNCYISTADRLSAQTSDGTSVTALTCATTLVPGQWYHVAIVWDRDGNCIGYLNGVSDGSTSIVTQDATLTNTQVMTVGRRSSGAAEFFPGYIDDLRIYTRVLTPTEILNLYNNGQVRIASITSPPAIVGAAIIG